MKTTAKAGLPPVPGGADRLLKKNELAAHLGVCERTIDNWRRDIGLPCLKIKHSVSFDLKRVMQHLEQHNSRPPGRSGRRRSATRTVRQPT
jgi:hypothetical protein